MDGGQSSGGLGDHRLAPISVEHLANKWAATLSKRRRMVATLAVAFSLAALAGLPRLQFEDSTRALHRVTDQDSARLAALRESFGDNKDFVVVLIEANDVLDSEILAEASRVSLTLRRLEGVEWVFGVEEILDRDPLALERTADHPLASQLVSPDRSELLVLVRLTHSAGRSIADIRPTLEEIREGVAAFSSPSWRARLTGVPFLRLAAMTELRRSVVTTNSLAFALCILVAWPLLRTWKRILAALIGPSVGILWLLGGMGWAGVPLTPLSIAAPALMLAVGLTDSVHLLHAQDRAKPTAGGRLESVRHALDAAFAPCLLTSITTAIAFGSLALSKLPLIQQFGWVCAAGSLLVGLTVLTLVPLVGLASWSGHSAQEQSPHSHRWDNLLRAACRHSPAVVVLGAVLTIVFAISAARLETDYKMGEVLPTQDPAYAALQPIEEGLGGAVWIDVLVTWRQGLGLDSLEVIDGLMAVHTALDNEEVTHRPFSIATVLAATPRTGSDPLAGIPEKFSSSLVDPVERRAVVHARIQDLGSRTLERGFQRLDREFERIENDFAGFEIGLTGTNALTYRGIVSVVRDLRRSLFVALALIAVVLAVGLRSVRLGLISTLPNAFPLLATAAVLAWLDQPLRFAGAMALTVGLGVAVDDSIHLAYRFRRRRAEGLDPENAAASAVIRLTPTLAVSSMILLAGFAALLSHPMPQGRIFAVVGGLTLLFALVGDTLLLPALLNVTARREQARPALD